MVGGLLKGGRQNWRILLAFGWLLFLDVCQSHLLKLIELDVYWGRSQVPFLFQDKKAHFFP